MTATGRFWSTEPVSHRRAVLILIGCTVIWGASFTVNKMLLEAVSPLLLLGIRSVIGAVLLAPVYRGLSRADVRAGAVLGTVFAIQLAFFITALDRIPSTRAAFLLGVCTPLVPVFVFLATRRRPTRGETTAVLAALAGTWLLTGGGSPVGGAGTGDLLMLASAVCAALYVVAAGHWAPRHDAFRLLAVQFVVMAIVALGLGLALETPRFAGSPAVLAVIAFLALSSVTTFGGQLAGQRLVRPTEAALIFALEPVVAAITGYLALGERLRGWQWAGATLILAATVASGLGRRAPVAPRADAPEPNPIA
jgi:drug/metabolite transporter (DMT)-like permease